jgi:helix-turn-helix protein
VSYVHVNYVREHSKTTGMARLLLLVIATRANNDGIAYPGYGCLARDTAMSIRSIRRLLERDPNHLEGEAPAIPADELEITPGGSEKGKKRRPTQYRILLGSNGPNAKKTMRIARTVNEEPTEDNHSHSDNGNCTPDTHREDGNTVRLTRIVKEKNDCAHTDTRPCASVHTIVRVVSSDCAPDAQLTKLNSNENKGANTRARARESAAPSPQSESKQQLSSFFSEAYFKEQQRKHPRIPDVRALYPEAQKKCAEKYPDGGAMRPPFYEEFLHIEELKLGPPGLLEEQERKQEELNEARRDRTEADRQRKSDGDEYRPTPAAPMERKPVLPEPTPEPKVQESLADFIARLTTEFPDVQVPKLATDYQVECDESGRPWNKKTLQKRIGEAYDRFLKT